MVLFCQTNPNNNRYFVQNVRKKQAESSACFSPSKNLLELCSKPQSRVITLDNPIWKSPI